MPLPDQISPSVTVGVREDPGVHLSIRIDSFRLSENTGEPSSDDPAELRIALLVIRKDGKSTKQIYPGAISPMLVAAGEGGEFGDFLLSIPDYQEDEEIWVYILAVDEDVQGEISGVSTDFAMNGALNVLEAALEGAEVLPKKGIADFITSSSLSALAGTSLGWWEQADIVGEHVLVLSPEENWYLGRQLHLANGNMEFYVSILDPTRPSATAAPTVQATSAAPSTPTVSPGIIATPTPTPTPTPLLPPPPPPSSPIAQQLLDSAISVRNAERVIGAEIDSVVNGESERVNCGNIISAYKTIETAATFNTSSSEENLKQANNLYQSAIEEIMRTGTNLYANCQNTGQPDIPAQTLKTARSGIANVEPELNRAIEILEALVK